MLPPGRRRSMRILPVFLALVIYFTSFATAASAVLGIDLGNEYIKAALVKPGVPMEIVLSKDSKRKEASVLAFKPQKGDIAVGSFPERNYGSDALALAARFPGDVYPNLKQLLGAAVESKVAKEYSRRYPALRVVEGVTGGVAFKSSAFHGDEEPWTVEELLAMELKNVKENAQVLAGKSNKVASAVFTIPAYFTTEERKALEAAAELAGLNVLGMVTDGLAVGLHYSTSRTFPSVTEGAKPEHHLVFDMGAGSTVATVLRMQGRTIKESKRFNKTVQEVTVLGAGWDKSLGGDALNMLIVDDMVSKFAETKKFKALGKTADDVKAHGRAMARMFKDSEKLRQVLSANKQTAATFEDLFEDTDFKYKVTRDEFEASANNLVDQLDGPINTALKAANLTVQDLDSVILYGGATRTPFVQTKLEQLVGDAAKLRSNVNADEAAVFGAAFKAAQISPSFRVKDIVAGDAASYSTFLQYTLDGKAKSQKLFTPTSLIGVSKQVPFKQLEDFSFSLYHSQGPADEGSSPPVTYTITTENLSKSVKELTEQKGCLKENITNNFYVRLNPVNGLPEVVRGQLTCIVDEPEKKSVVEGVKDMFGFGKKDQEPLKADESSSTEGQSSSSTSSGSESSKSTASAKESKAAVKESKPKQRMEMQNIEFNVKCEGCNELPKEELERMEKRLKAFDAADKARREREEDMNNLESFLYKARSSLEDEEFILYSSKAERASLTKLVDAVGDWMYEKEGQSATADVLKAKLKEMTDVVNPVHKRKDEAVLRPDAIKALKEALEKATTFVNMIKNILEEAAKSSSATSTSISEPSTSASSRSADALDDLEEPVSAEPEDPVATPDLSEILSQYSQEDVQKIEELYNGAKTFLEERLQKQEKLSVTDDPAFAAEELKAKARTLSDEVMKIFERKMKVPPKASSKSKSKSKTKSKKTSSSTAAESETVTISIPKDSATDAPKEEPRDEL